jgi:hypothetical protein
MPDRSLHPLTVIKPPENQDRKRYAGDLTVIKTYGA